MLADFAATHGITFPLLSDEGSAVIRALGLTDHRYDDRPPGDHHVGVPHPGTFLLGTDGTIVGKRFEESHRRRPSAPSLFADLVDRPGPVAVSGTADGPALAAAAWVAEPDYRPLEVARVEVSLQVADGFHVYAPPTPPGYTALAVGLAPLDDMTFEPPALPAGEPFRMADLDEEFFVLSGTVRTSLSFAIERDRGPVVLTVRVRYQACDERTCEMPATLEIALPLAAGAAFAREAPPGLP